MASDLLSFTEEEELAFEKAIVHVVQGNVTELSNLSFMSLQQKFSAVLESMLTRSGSRVFFGGPFTAKSPREPPF